MEVHAGKTHADSFECGLCSYNSETIENLELHLITCEVYICGKCDLREKNLSELKKHAKKEHFVNDFFTIYHRKMDRTNQGEVCNNGYHWDKI